MVLFAEMEQTVGEAQGQKNNSAYALIIQLKISGSTCRVQRSRKESGLEDVYLDFTNIH
jgi:hypothetical protein